MYILLIIVAISVVIAQKGTGQTTSTVCPTLTSCAKTGSSNYYTPYLSYNATSGTFSGYLITNLCNNHPILIVDGVNYQADLGGPTTACVNQTIPAFSNTPYPAPVLGAIGFSASGGVNIFGPLDNGFTTGQVCSTNAGYCATGTDIASCVGALQYACGSSLEVYYLIDDCGGHASPYHYHYDLACDYSINASGHSALIGVMLDGRGLYGQHESTGVVPSDLDYCGGHYGPVPASEINGTSYPAASYVYHYHTQVNAPYTAGCYGPVTTLAQCKSLYSACDNSTYYVNISTSSGCYVNFNTFCPCFSSTFNQLTVGPPCNSTSSGNSTTTSTGTSTTTTTGTSTTTTGTSTTTTTGTSTTTTTGTSSTATTDVRVGTYSAVWAVLCVVVMWVY